MTRPILQDRVTLVTGAARGIGRGIATCMAEAGAHVVINDVNPGREGDELAKEISGMGREAMVFKADVSDRGQVEAMVAAVLQRFGRIDILVNNAGIHHPQPFLKMEQSSWDRVLAVDLEGVFHCSQVVAREMVRRGQGGKIVIISSVHAETNFPEALAYDVAKAGVAMLGRGMALELARHRINVNVIAPGWIETPLSEPYLRDPKERAAVEATIPWGRVGTPRDIGQLSAFLASEEADYITGAYIRCDGGYVLSRVYSTPSQ